MQHSKVVGGSTAKRVIHCPGSVALVAQMPAKPSSSYADTGNLLHNAMDLIYGSNVPPRNVIGMTYEGIVLTEELYEDKIIPAMQAVENIDPAHEMEYATETKVAFGDLLPGVFGTTDMLGRIGKRAIVLDWKFGDGVPVPAEESEQHMFYAAAGMRTAETAWVFDGCDEVELIVVQPPHVRRWVTTPERIKAFELELVAAVKKSMRADAPLSVGEHCRWCAAKPICPKMTGAVDRALKVSLEGLPAAHIAGYMANADLLEQWITDLRALAFQMLDKGVAVPGYKLVAKRANRSWKDEGAALVFLAQEGIDPFKPKEVISPAVAEKALKKVKKELPAEMIQKISSGNTLASEDDPREPVLQLGQHLAALSKLV
jgi:hypothetical protein